MVEKSEAMFSTLYTELHRLAKRQLDKGGSAALSTTTLLHEAYLALSQHTSATFPDEARFIGYAARVMRGIIIDFARKGHAQKRGGQFIIARLDTDDLAAAPAPEELGRLAEALDELAAVDGQLSQVVELRYFCGFSFGEIAAMQGVSERTVQRQWDKARLHLHRALAPT